MQTKRSSSEEKKQNDEEKKIVPQSDFNVFVHTKT